MTACLAKSIRAKVATRLGGWPRTSLPRRAQQEPAQRGACFRGPDDRRACSDLPGRARRRHARLGAGAARHPRPPLNLRFPRDTRQHGEPVAARSYEAAPSAIKQIARKTTAKDFKEKHALQFSEGPGLEKVNENGEFKRGTFAEGKNSFKLETFGKVFRITRKALVNDDLGAFDTVTVKLGRAASAFEAQHLVRLLLVDNSGAGPVMGDGKTLFHADHGNLGTASPLASAALKAARRAMRAQVGLTGELICVTAKYLVVSPDLEAEAEAEAEQLLTELYAAAVSDVNPLANKLTLIVEPRLTAPYLWYVADLPNEIDWMENAYLEGVEGPELFTQHGFDIDGVENKVRTSFGAGFVEHRGWYRNPGAAPTP